MTLCRFFKAAVATIDAMTTYMINPFLEMADKRSGEGKRLGNYSLGDLKRTVRPLSAPDLILADISNSRSHHKPPSLSVHMSVCSTISHASGPTFVTTPS
jgi:hypothetical protein